MLQSKIVNGGQKNEGWTLFIKEEVKLITFLDNKKEFGLQNSTRLY